MAYSSIRKTQENIQMTNSEFTEVIQPESKWKFQNTVDFWYTASEKHAKSYG